MKHSRTLSSQPHFLIACFTTPSATSTVSAKSVGPAFCRRPDRRLNPTKQQTSEGGQILTWLDKR